MGREPGVDYGTLPAVTPERLTLVIDGRCGMCTRSAHFLSRLDRDARIELVPSQGEGVLERTGVTQQEAELAAWALGDDVRVGGARAIALALAVARQSRWPRWPWRIPGMPWILDRVYRFVANHRSWFPAETPWCEQYPGECIDR